jgi:hypothetical protein
MGNCLCHLWSSKIKNPKVSPGVSIVW